MRFVAAIAAAVSLCAAASAQQLLSTRQAVDLAMESHPLLGAESAKITAAEGLRAQAGLRPNPKIIVQNENARFHGTPGVNFWRDTESFAYVQQPFQTAGKRERRMDAAAAAVRRSELERELLARQIGYRVKLAYWEAAGARKLYETMVENLHNFEQIVQYHEIRVREGAMAEVDLIRVRLESERFEIAANAALLEAERARIQMFREMGQTHMPSVIFADELELPPSEPSIVNTREVLSNRTEMKIAAQQVAQARAELGLQSALATPDVDGLFGVKRTLGFNTVFGGLQFDLPMLNRNQGNVAAASAQIRAAEGTLAAAKALVEAEAAMAERELELRRRQIQQSMAALLANAADSSEIARAAYREGGSDLLRLLDAERVRIEVQQLYYRLLAEYRAAEVNLQAAWGIDP